MTAKNAKRVVQGADRVLEQLVRRAGIQVVHHRLSSSESSLAVALVPRSATSLG